MCVCVGGGGSPQTPPVCSIHLDDNFTNFMMMMMYDDNNNNTCYYSNIYFMICFIIRFFSGVGQGFQRHKTVEPATEGLGIMSNFVRLIAVAPPSGRLGRVLVML